MSDTSCNNYQWLNCGFLLLKDGFIPLTNVTINYFLNGSFVSLWILWVLILEDLYTAGNNCSHLHLHEHTCITLLFHSTTPQQSAHILLCHTQLALNSHPTLGSTRESSWYFLVWLLFQRILHCSTASRGGDDWSMHIRSPPPPPLQVAWSMTGHLASACNSIANYITCATYLGRGNLLINSPIELQHVVFFRSLSYNVFFRCQSAHINEMFMLCLLENWVYTCGKVSLKYLK
jgi:hypothetical protein